MSILLIAVYGISAFFCTLASFLTFGRYSMGYYKTQKGKVGNLTLVLIWWLIGVNGAMILLPSIKQFLLILGVFGVVIFGNPLVIELKKWINEKRNKVSTEAKQDNGK